MRTCSLPAKQIKIFLPLSQFHLTSRAPLPIRTSVRTNTRRFQLSKHFSAAEKYNDCAPSPQKKKKKNGEKCIHTYAEEKPAAAAQRSSHQEPLLLSQGDAALVNSRGFFLRPAAATVVKFFKFRRLDARYQSRIDICVRARARVVFLRRAAEGVSCFFLLARFVLRTGRAGGWRFFLFNLILIVEEFRFFERII